MHRLRREHTRIPMASRSNSLRPTHSPTTSSDPPDRCSQIGARLARPSLRTEKLKKTLISTPQFAPRFSRYPAIFLQSAEVGVTKSDSKSVAYKNRTKSAKCGGLETNGPRERISGLERVRRSAEVYARSPWLLAISARQNPAEKIGRGRTGGGRGPTS